VQGIPRDQTQALEVVLHRLLGQEEGRVDGPYRMRRDPSLQTSGTRIHVHHHHKVQQRVAFTVVLHQELRCCPSSALHWPYDCDGSTGMVMGACGQGEEEARPTPGRHRVAEGSQPLWRWHIGAYHSRRVRFRCTGWRRACSWSAWCLLKVCSKIQRSSNASRRRWKSLTRPSWSRVIRRCGLTPASSTW
jgi:hypothetical protein